MKKIGKLEVGNALLCDDIRKEAETNKHILIGVFSGDMVVPSLPANVQLAIYIDFISPAGEHGVEVRISGPGEGSAVLAAHISQPEPGLATLVSPRVEIHLEQEGVLKIDVRSGGKWANLIKKRVMLPAPTA